MFLYAEKGSQAEYEAFAALSALVPAEVSEAVPLQIRQLAPRPPVQNDVIDLVQIDSPTVPSATSAATTAQTLLANQLCESLSTRLLHGVVTNLPNVSLHMFVERITSETEGFYQWTFDVDAENRFVAAEVATLREAVKTVREAAEALQMASDEAQKPMQRLNLREARSILVSCLVL